MRSPKFKDFLSSTACLTLVVILMSGVLATGSTAVSQLVGEADTAGDATAFAGAEGQRRVLAGVQLSAPTVIISSASIQDNASGEGISATQVEDTYQGRNGSIYATPEVGICAGEGVLLELVSGGALWVYRKGSNSSQVLRKFDAIDIFGANNTFRPQCVYDEPTGVFFLVASNDETGQVQLGIMQSPLENTRCSYTITPYLPEANFSKGVAFDPEIGVNENAICISFLHRNGTSADLGDSLGAQILCYPKAPLVQQLVNGSCGTITASVFRNLTPIGGNKIERIVAAINQPGSPTTPDTIWFAGRSDSSQDVLVVGVTNTSGLLRDDNSIILYSRVVTPSQTFTVDAVYPTLSNGVGLRIAAPASRPAFGAGQLYFGFNVDVTVGGEIPAKGIYFYRLQIALGVDALAVTVLQEEVLALPGGASIFNPSFAVAPDGTAVMGVTVAGPDNKPTLGVVQLGATGSANTFYPLFQGDDLAATCLKVSNVNGACAWDWYTSAVYDNTTGVAWLASQIAMPSKYLSGWSTAIAGVPLPLVVAIAPSPAPTPSIPDSLPPPTRDFMLSPPPPASGSSKNSSGSGSSIAPIVGGAVGGIAVVAALVVLLCCLVFRKRRGNSAAAKQSSVAGSAKGADSTLPSMATNSSAVPQMQNSWTSGSATGSYQPPLSGGGPADLKVRDMPVPSSLALFTAEELAAATNNYSESNRVGAGASGEVYRGVLANGTLAAIKRFPGAGSKSTERSFAAEVSLISRLQHINLVRLRGWCTEGDNRLLVYEYMEGGSLDKALYGPEVLPWEARRKIIGDTAKALNYMHHEWEEQVVHRDIKVSNILLDGKFENARLGDFGLATAFSHLKSFTYTAPGFTFCYAPPEAMVGQATTKGDVFSFGVVLLEMLSGRAPFEPRRAEEEIILLGLAWSRLQEDNLISIADPRLDNKYPREEMEHLLRIGVLCTCYRPVHRPTMAQVCHALNDPYLTKVQFPADSGPPPSSAMYNKVILGSSTTGSLSNTGPTLRPSATGILRDPSQPRPPPEEGPTPSIPAQLTQSSVTSTTPSYVEFEDVSVIIPR